VLTSAISVLTEGGHGSVPTVDPTSAGSLALPLVLVIALPALGALVLLLGGRRTDRFGHLFGTATVIGSFVCAVVLFVSLIGRADDNRQVGLTLWTWFSSGDWKVEMGLLYDPLSALFLLLITGVGSLIFIYSIGYMEHDERRRRFFGYLNLFVASMLVLVLASDYVGVFLGWEGVGLASYLLIGFWQYKPTAAAAAKKAFVINRVGDIGLSLGVGLIFVTFGSTSFAKVSTLTGGASQGVMTAIGLLLLLAACGKSAQFPLQTWLLDAMEGPTPVSALIHAATMVTAGVYLIVRSQFIFEYTADARLAVATIGTITLLMGAWIGCAKDDIKKTLAGSTMSQIGYMILASGLGVAGYAFAIFHLLNHGFFKANMFLGAGSVMHGTEDDVNMRHYGALRKLMPITFITFTFGYLAIIGIPPFSGFWSKDKIIEVALTQNYWLGICAMLGAGVTGFYMTRLMIMTFISKDRWEPDVHPHESPKVMTIPLMVLAALSALGGLMLLNDWIVDFLAPVTGAAPHEEPPLPAWAISVIVLVIVAIGVAIAWTLFGRREVPRTAPTKVSVFTTAGRNELYGDAFNDTVIVGPGKRFNAGLATFDGSVVDGGTVGLASAIRGLSGRMRLAQNGFVRSYALSVLAGAALVLLALVVVNL
jgi:NADH-quinone oxidoreductase subunit L